MKYYIPFAIILIVVGSLWFVLNKNEAPSLTDSKIKWNLNVKEGLEFAKQHQKPVLVFFSASWCYWCRKLNHDVFMNDQVVKLSESFVNILVDVDKNSDIARKFGVRGVPDIYFIKNDGKSIIQYNGNRTAEDMIDKMYPYIKTF